MSSKRILVYSTQFMPTGGIESHLQEFCYRMAQAGVEIDLVILNSRMLPETKTHFAANCKQLYLASYKYPFTRLLYLFFVSIRLAFRRYTSLYTNGQGESVKLFASLFHFKKWVHHHHTSGDAADQATWGKEYIKALKTANIVIACSGINAKLIAAYLNRSIDVIPCFSRKIEIDEKKELRKRPLKFGYYGRLIPEKGIDVMCRLSEDVELNGIEFHIWGEGEAYTVQFFDKYKKVFYHGAFSGIKDLTNVIASLDAYLLLSVHPEGLPISLLEVMSAGLPWLATNKGGIPDIANDPLSTRVIEARADYDTIKSAILNLAADIRDGKISKSAQKKLYTDQFSADALVVKWKQVLQLI